MKKSLFFFLVIVIFSSCKTLSGSKDTVACTEELIISINNNSLYEVEIVFDNPTSKYIEERLLSGEKKELKYNILEKENKSYFLFPRFTVNLAGEKIRIYDPDYFFRIETKNGLTQSINIDIKNNFIPLDEKYYVVLNNKANFEISVINSSSNQIYLTKDGVKAIKSEDCGIYLSSGRDFINNDYVTMFILAKNKKIMFPIGKLKKGYVYTYEFDGKSVYRTDSRPLLKQAEPTWSLEIENNLEINDIEIQKDSIYITGTQIKTDNNSNKYNSAFTCYFETDISTYKEKKLTINYEENQADSTTFFDLIIKEDGNIISVGQRVDKEPKGLVSCYSNSGSLLWNKTLADVYAVSSIIQITENDFFVAGSNYEGKALVYKLKENDSKEFEFITSIEVIDSAIYDTKSCISSDGKYLYLVCNAQENMTNLVISSLFRIDIESGVSEEIKLNNTIRFVEDIKQAKDGTVYLVGETVTDTASSVALMAVKQNIAESKLVYVAPETYSYGRSIYVDEGFNEIVFCGTLNATDSSGNGGTPFIRSLYRKDYSVAWEKLYTEECFSDMEVVREFVPCYDYGFVVNLCAVDEEGRFCEPTQLVRTNATGNITENHILIGKD